MPEIVNGRVDLAGKLIEADPQLLRLQKQAGSGIGGDLAIPPLAGMVRLARTLGILISRTVFCASGDSDIELMVRARPDKDGVDLTISGWIARPPRQPWLVEPDRTASETHKRPLTSTWQTNARFEILKASGFGDRPVVGLNLTQVFRLIDDSFDTMPILTASATATDFKDQPATLRANPGQEVLLSGRAVLDPMGKFAGYAGTSEFVPGAAIEDAETTNDSKAAFTEKLDAALRVPLGRIVANADSISAQTDGPLRRDYADYAGDIASAARHLLALVDDLSDLQTVEQPDFLVETEEIDLAELARQAAGLLNVRAGNRLIRIDRPGLDDALIARGNYHRVLQILVNLIGNAIRYSPDGGMIWIRTEKDADTAVMIVADQGKGIEALDQSRIFEKFERVDISEPGGSGLGLFISRRLAQAMGGDIVVDSAPGQGARFILTLPAA